MDIARLETMIARGQDSAMLRLMLARLLVQSGRLDEAASHLASAVTKDPGYSAAWKELGQVHRTLGQNEKALTAWRKGIEVARANGDKQAEKEMGVFVRRLVKAGSDR